MKKKITLSTLLILFFLQTFSQSPNWLWAKRIGGLGADVANSIAVDASGNVFTTGQFNGTVDFDPGAGIFNLTSSFGMFISKLDGMGNFMWAKAFEGTTYVKGSSIAIDASGNIYTTGSFEATADFDPGVGTFNLTSVAGKDIFISKLDNSGNFVWAKRIGGFNDDVANSIAVDASGNVYTTGHFNGTVDFDPGLGTFNLTSSIGNAFDIFISKLNSSGDFIWAKVMGGTSFEEGISIAIDQTGNGNVYTTGNFIGTTDFDPGAGTYNLTTVGSRDIFISKLDHNGNFMWAKTIGGTNGDYGHDIIIDPTGSGNVYTTGYFSGTVDFNPGTGLFNLSSAGVDDIFISKLDGSGNFLWAKAMGGTGYDEGNSISIDVLGNVYTTGFFETTTDFDPNVGTFNLTALGTDMFISKLDSLGNFKGAKSTGGTGGDIGKSIALNSSCHVLVTGYFFSPTILFGSTTLTNASVGPADIYIAKLDTLVIGIKEVEKFDHDIFLFPNPVILEINLNFGNETHHEVQLCNTLGEILFQATTSAEQMKIDVGDFPKGIYFVVVRDGGNGLVVRKVVKM